MSSVPAVLTDLDQRHLISQSTDRDALAALFAAGPVTYYCGFDPSAPSLHIGNLVQILTLRRLQQAGNLPLALVGGATGLIGDPKMTGERTLNDPEIVAGWVERIRSQIAPLLDFEGKYAARMVNNLDWTAPLSAIDLLRGVGKHFRMSTMLAKETVARRLASDQGISFTEFSYQVLQGMDFRELYRRYGCRLQTGGNDQWGNLLAGVELIHKAEGATAHAFTTPLITKADGTKFGKTETGTVWLDPAMCTPYAFYQFWLNQDDRDVVGYLKVFTFRSLEQIAELEQATNERPHERAAQRALAWDVTALVHGEAAAQGAVDAAQALFGQGDLARLDLPTLEAAIDGLPDVVVPATDPAPTVVDLLVGTQLEKSKGAARRTLASGGVYLNNQKVTDPEAAVPADVWLHGQYAIVRRGRKTLAVAKRV
ncbi:MAG: tyrosine--tRNA ligase [Bifidobacteriaceae bacterium]|nr:tyrosine--tRNA ligase [Bifidobacteriaceae bacterium]